MKSITEIISNPERRQSAPAPLTDQERDSVAYFFLRLKLIDPKWYDEIMPDKKTEDLVKREHMNMIRAFSRQKIDFGMGELKKIIGNNHPDYRRLTISKVAMFIGNGGSPDPPAAGMYKIAPPAIVSPDRLLCSPRDAAKAKPVQVLNPATGQYSTAVVAPKASLSVDDKNAAERSLGSIFSLFDQDAPDEDEDK
jgi:hypothetical protein